MELQTGLTERPYDTTTATSVLALCASSFAAGYLVYKDPTYLTHAKSLYEAADKNRSNDILFNIFFSHTNNITKS